MSATRIHLELAFNEVSGARGVCWYELNETLLHKLSLWQGAQAKTPTTIEVRGWLQQQEAPLDRIDGPAHVETDSKGVHRELWQRGNKLHREDGPARITTGVDGGDIKEEWYIDGILHREDGPAIHVTRKDGYICEEWYQAGDLHREDGPSFTQIMPNGETKEIWYRNGQLHRENGPAMIEVLANGDRTEKWYVRGELTQKIVLKNPANIPGITLHRTPA